MELTILERLMLNGILPAQGNIFTLKIIQELKMALAFSEEEIEEHEIAKLEDNRGLKWKPESNEWVKDISIGPKAMSVIVEELERRNEAKELTAEFISLYDKFMETTK